MNHNQLEFNYRIKPGPLSRNSDLVDLIHSRHSINNVYVEQNILDEQYMNEWNDIMISTYVFILLGMLVS